VAASARAWNASGAENESEYCAVTKLKTDRRKDAQLMLTLMMGRRFANIRNMTKVPWRPDSRHRQHQCLPGSTSPVRQPVGDGGDEATRRALHWRHHSQARQRVVRTASWDTNPIRTLPEICSRGVQDRAEIFPEFKCQNFRNPQT